MHVAGCHVMRLFDGRSYALRLEAGCRDDCAGTLVEAAEPAACVPHGLWPRVCQLLP